MRRNPFQQHKDEIEARRRKEVRAQPLRLPSSRASQTTTVRASAARARAR
jgi:hypothetical protein